MSGWKEKNYFHFQILAKLLMFERYTQGVLWHECQYSVGNCNGEMGLTPNLLHIYPKSGRFTIIYLRTMAALV